MPATFEGLSQVREENPGDFDYRMRLAVLAGWVTRICMEFFSASEIEELMKTPPPSLREMLLLTEMPSVDTGSRLVFRLAYALSPNGVRGVLRLEPVEEPAAGPFLTPT